MMIRLRRLIAALVAVAGLGAPVVDAATVTVRQTVVARQSIPGRIDAAYLDGDDASPVVWGTCPNLSLNVGDDTDFDLRELCSLTGTNAATATLAKLSGTLPTGCVAGTNGIECTDPQALAASALVWRATDAGQDAYSNAFTIAVTSPFSPDVTPPAQVTGCTATPGEGTVTVECDQSSDPYVSGAGSGVASYEIYLDGALKTTKPAQAANAQPQFTAWTVGSADGTQSCTQDGSAWTMSGGGAGLGSTADQFYGCGQQAVGDFIATAKITGFTGATASTAGWALRATTAAGSIYGSARARASDIKANNRYRLTTDGSAGNGTLSAAQTYSYWLRLLYSGGTVQPLISVDGNNFSAVESARSVSLGGSPYLMLFHASGSAGTTTTSSFEQVSVAPVTPWSQVVTTSVGGSWTVKAVDAADNASAASAAITASPALPPDPEPGECTGDPAPQLVHVDEFDAETFDFEKWNVSQCINGDAFSMTQDPACGEPVTTRARSGPRSLRTQLTFHNGTTGSNTWYHKKDNPVDVNAHRNGFRHKTWQGWNPDSMRNGQELWYGFSMFLPATGDPFGDPVVDVSMYNSYHIGPQWHDSPDRWYGSSQAGTNSTTVVLPTTFSNGDTASSVNGYYVGGNIIISGQSRAVTGYVGTTRTITVGTAFTSSPTAGMEFTLQEQSRNPVLAFSLSGTPHDTPTTNYPDTVGGNWNDQPSPPTKDPVWWYISSLWDADVFQGHRNYDGSHRFFPGEWTDDLGQWIDWVVRYKANHTSAGILEVWKNGVKVVSHFGPNAFNDTVAPFFWIGQYSGFRSVDSNVPADWPARVVIYYDAVKTALAPNNPSSAVGTDNCAYRQVVPSGTPH